jgi:hypothetical protein
MMVSFDTSILVCATLSAPPSRKHTGARSPLTRNAYGIERFCCKRSQSSAAWPQGGNRVDEVRTTIDAWRAVLPAQGTEDDDLSAALNAVKNHRLAFWDAMLWGAAQRAGVRHAGRS